MIYDTQDIEILAMKLWQEETGKTYGWGSAPETYEFRRKAKETLKNNKQ